MAVTACYRLLKFAKARRILFLVDRTNLGRQTEKEFQQYTIPDSGRPFTQEYNVQHPQSGTIDDVSDVCISTIQRIYYMLKGGDPSDLDEDTSIFETTPTGEIRDVMYNTGSRRRPSTSSSSTSVTAPSTTSGGRCWSTSTLF